MTDDQRRRDAVPNAIGDMNADADARAIASALKLFLARGIGPVKMTEIAEAANVGVATLYRHFTTKAALAAAVGVQLWEGLVNDYAQLVRCADYQALDGAARLERLLDTYCAGYLYQPGFAAFLDELDRLVLSGDVDEARLAAYTRVVNAAYPSYEAAYQLGCTDGSLARDVDFALFYRSLAHALLCVAGKLQRGEILPSDDFSSGNDELACLVDMAITSLRARPQ